MLLDWQRFNRKQNYRFGRAHFHASFNYNQPEKLQRAFKFWKAMNICFIYNFLAIIVSHKQRYGSTLKCILFVALYNLYCVYLSQMKSILLKVLNFRKFIKRNYKGNTLKFNL